MSTATTTVKTATLAMLAILEHAVDHKLNLNSIDAPDRIVHDVPRVRVAPTDLHLWLDTLTGVDHKDPTVRRGAGLTAAWETVVHRGHLDTAIGRLELEVSTTRRAVVPLRVVAS